MSDKLVFMEQLQIICKTNCYLVTTSVIPPSNLFGGTSLGHGQLEEILKKLTEQQQMLSLAASDNKELKDSVAAQ